MKNPISTKWVTRALMASLGAVLMAASPVAGGVAFAYDGFTVGVGSTLPYRGAVVVNARAIYPLTEFLHHDERLQLSARGDASYGVGMGVPPALALSAVLSSESSEAHSVESYLGAGTGVSFAGTGLTNGTVALLFFSGGRVPLAGGLAAAAEFQLAATGTVLVSSIGLALEYSLGGRQ